MTSGVYAFDGIHRRNRRLATPPAGVGPQTPGISTKDLLCQFRKDVGGKEVQSANTYSYTWLADQFGHVCVGILLFSVITFTVFLVKLFFNFNPLPFLFIGFFLEAALFVYWEHKAYRSSVREATRLFPLDRRLLRYNAVTAVGYLVIGAVVGFAFTWSALGWPLNGLAVFAAALVVAVLVAPWWLRQKIVWQKAALPYLFRLADAQRTMSDDEADELQAFINAGAPPSTPPRQVIIGGPIGSGRTSLAAGIGTEFAFNGKAVRYLSLDNLLEFAVRSSAPSFADDPGPCNIKYWRWSKAQVVIIDDVAPLLAARHHEHRTDLPKLLRELLDNELAVAAPVLARCHTVWVVGDHHADGEAATVENGLREFARAIAGYCRAKQDVGDDRQEVLVVELSEAPKVAAPAKTKLEPKLLPLGPARLHKVSID